MRSRKFPSARYVNLLWVLVACASFTSAGCGGKGARLEGTWSGVKAEGVTAEAQAAADDFARDMKLTFKGDEVTVRSPRDTSSTKFKIQSATPTQIVVVTVNDGPNEAQTFLFKDAKDTTLRWKVLPEATIVFQHDAKK